MLIAVEIREDSTVALLSAQGETIARLQSLLRCLARRDDSSPTGRNSASRDRDADSLKTKNDS